MTAGQGTEQLPTVPDGGLRLEVLVLTVGPPRCHFGGKAADTALRHRTLAWRVNAILQTPLSPTCTERSN